MGLALTEDYARGGRKPCLICEADTNENSKTKTKRLLDIKGVWKERLTVCKANLRKRREKRRDRGEVKL